MKGERSSGFGQMTSLERAVVRMVSPAILLSLPCPALDKDSSADLEGFPPDGASPVPGLISMHQELRNSLTMTKLMPSSTLVKPGASRATPSSMSS